MLFTSCQFWIFAASAAVVFYLFLRKIRRPVLPAASLFFYGYWKIGFLCRSNMAGHALFVCLTAILAVNSTNEFLYVKF